MTAAQKYEFYSGLDWQKPITALAKETKLSVPCLFMWRKKLGLRPSSTRGNYSWNERTKVTREQYLALDWVNKTDSMLAKETNVSRERIRQVRIALGRPKSKWKYHQPYKPCHQVRQYATEHPFTTCQELSAKFGLAPQTVSLMTRGIPGRPKNMKSPTIVPWHLMNWQLTNVTLHRIWKVSTVQQVANNRNWRKKGKAKWDGRNKSYKSGSDELLSAIAAEQAKAQEWFTVTRGPRVTVVEV